MTERLVWHVVSRGWRGTEIFRDEEDFRSFHKVLGEKAQAVGVPVLAYCLMANHFHLLVEADGPTLAAFAMRLKTSHAIRFNKRHIQYGTLFEGRYAGIPVHGAHGVAYVSAYIHQNPVTAGIAHDPMAYLWSSARRFEAGARPEPWLDTGKVLRAVHELGGDPSPSYGEYLARWAADRCAAFPDANGADDPTGWVFERRVAILRRFFGDLCKEADTLTDGNPAAVSLAIAFGVWASMRSRLVGAKEVAAAAAFRGPLAVYSVNKKMKDWRSKSNRYHWLGTSLMALWPPVEEEIRPLSFRPHGLREEPRQPKGCAKIGLERPS